MAKDYRAIAASKIRTPSEKAASQAARPPRFLVYARNKKGKTRFCSTPGTGKVLIVDPEEGTDEMQTIDPHTWQIESWDDLDDLYKFLRLGDHGYEWVAIDGMTRICNMALRWVLKQNEERALDMRPGMINVKDHGRAGEMVKGLIYNLHALRVGLIFTAQERMVESDAADGEDEDADSGAASFVPDLPKGVRGSLNSVVDVIGRLYVVKAEVKVRRGEEIITKEMAQRRLWVSPNASYDTGYRSDHVLPDYLKSPTVPKLHQLIKTGKVGTK